MAILMFSISALNVFFAIVNLSFGEYGNTLSGAFSAAIAVF